MKKIIAAVSTSLLMGSALADINHGFSRPDSHAPLGIMGDHTHNEGEAMISYRYMHMKMDGNRIGTDRVSSAQARAAGPFMAAPLDMDMKMHMLGAMYAPSNNVTLMAMVPFVSKKMDHERGNLTTFRRDTDSIGDISLGALVNFYQEDGGSAHFNVALGIPAGSIDEEFNGSRLPYPMQNGSGSYAAKFGITMTQLFNSWSIGTQLMHEEQLENNDNGYRLGTKRMVNVWAATRISKNVSISLRNQYMKWDNISGADSTLNPGMIETARTDLRAGSRADIGLGVNTSFNGGHRVSAEVLSPYYQNLDGPQLETDWSAVLGYQYAW